MDKGHVQRARNVIRRWAVAAALGCVWLTVGAQPVVPGSVSNQSGPYSNFGAWYYGGGMKFGTQGTNMVPGANPMPTGPTNYSGWTRAGNYGMAPEATGITINQSADYNVPGAKAPQRFNFRSFANMASIGAAISGFGAVAGVIQAGMAIYDLMAEMGYRPGQGGSIERKDPKVCSVAPCYEYRVTSAGDTQWHWSKAEACNVAAAIYVAGGYGELTGSTQMFCYIYRSNGSYVNGFGIDPRSIEARPPVFNPSTWQEFQDDIASKSGWPTSSNVARAAKDAMDKGFMPKVEQPTVSGPGSADGPKEEKQNPDGSKEVKQTTINFNYNGNTVTTTATTVTNYYNASGAQTGTKTETTDTPVDEKEDECKAHPQSVGCTDLDTPEGEIPKTSKALTYTAETLGISGGGCPADIVKTIGGKSVTVFSYAFACDTISTKVKPLFLLMAAFVAFMIVMPGGKPQ